MLEILVPLIAGASLVIFILWDVFCPQKPISRKTLEAGFQPGETAKVTALFALGATGVCFSLVLITTPEHPPFTGRGAFISNVLYALFGYYGQPLLCFGLSIAAIAAGFVTKNRLSRKKGNTKC